MAVILSMLLFEWRGRWPPLPLLFFRPQKVEFVVWPGSTPARQSRPLFARGNGRALSGEAVAAIPAVPVASKPRKKAPASPVTVYFLYKVLSVVSLASSGGCFI